MHVVVVNLERFRDPVTVPGIWLSPVAEWQPRAGVFSGSDGSGLCRCRRSQRRILVGLVGFTPVAFVYLLRHISRPKTQDTDISRRVVHWLPTKPASRHLDPRPLATRIGVSLQTFVSRTSSLLPQEFNQLANQPIANILDPRLCPRESPYAHLVKLLVDFARKHCALRSVGNVLLFYSNYHDSLMIAHRQRHRSM
jgi:hypothetical protein